MRGFYTAEFKITGLAASRTLMYLTAPALRCVECICCTVTNASNVTNQQLEIAIKNITTVGAPTATTVTPTPHESGDQAAGSTVKANVTAGEPTYGTTIFQEGAPSLPGFRYEPVEPLERLWVTAAASIGIFMNVLPTSFDCDVRLTFREVG